ncbi:hypothetical protein C1Y40_00147 [Mycobacterium talmoniae]|uniref:Uncharacterized protein n=1 Tax=Mycobacterium talmoniae TaxID=1858794 RepID=A0A2S8BSH2_9MYCO|nr:hypothetical protein C1Y40_00147 [Mycobacterium talmoniae]
MAISNSSSVESSPPGSCGTRPPTVPATVGCTSSVMGMTTTLTAMSRNISASQRRKEPPATTANNSAAAAGIAIALGHPRNPSARETPMNSVTIVNPLRINRSPTLNAPQNLPNRAKISRAWPTPVTAPNRSTISWLT